MSTQAPTAEHAINRQIARRAFTGWSETLGFTAITGTVSFQDDNPAAWDFHNQLHTAEDAYPGITKEVIGRTVTVGMDEDFMNTYTAD